MCSYLDTDSNPDADGYSNPYRYRYSITYRDTYGPSAGILLSCL